MNQKRIITPNFYAPGRGYFERAVRPSLAATQDVVAPTIVKIMIAGKNIHLYLYGTTAARVFPPAFAHQEPSILDPDLTIHAWDSATTGWDPTAPWDDPDYQHPSEQSDPDFFGAYVGGEESLSFYDRTDSTAYFWMHDTSELADWSTGAPFRAILHWFLGTHGIHLLHGAVIGQSDSAVLITAKSGAGKSTTALASVLAGMDYISDDYAAFEIKNNQVITHSLYQSAKVTRQGLEFFPELKPLVWNKDFSGNQKAVVFLKDLIPDQVKTSSQLKAVFIPRITGGETRLVPASRVQVLVALAPTTMLQLPLAETRTLSALKQIVERVPCYFLDLGPEIREIPTVIKEFLKNAL